MPGARAFTVEELDLLESRLKEDAQLHLIWVIAYYTGLRIGQIGQLTIQQVYEVDVIHIPRKRVGHTKQSTPRDIPVHPKLKAHIKTYLSALAARGWSNERGSRVFTYTYDQCEHRLHDIILRANLPGKCSWHSLRSNFILRMYERLGRDIVATSKAVGHASISNTAVYIGVDHDRITKAILED